MNHTTFVKSMLPCQTAQTQVCLTIVCVVWHYDTGNGRAVVGSWNSKPNAIGSNPMFAFIMIDHNEGHGQLVMKTFVGTIKNYIILFITTSIINLQ